MNEQVVGHAVIETEGLYSAISCFCKFPDKRIYMILLKQGSENRPLGICVPVRDGFCLHTRIPKKYIRTEQAIICAAVKEENRLGDFVPLLPGEPVGCIGQLDQVTFKVSEGVRGLFIVSR